MPEASWLQSASPAVPPDDRHLLAGPGLWPGKQEQAIREAIGAGMDWMEYIRLVDRHRTPALSWAALSRVPGLEIPSPQSRNCRSAAMPAGCRLSGIP
jgi:hypothetical protein